MNGSVLKQIDAANPVWVAHADLDARVTPEAHRAQQFRQRARRATARLPRRTGAGGAAGELNAEPHESQD